MAKDIVVIFTENNVRFKVNPENLDYYRSLSNCVVNPDLRTVKDIKPHFWKLNEDKTISAMGKEEQRGRQAHIDAEGAKNNVIQYVEKKEEEVFKMDTSKNGTTSYVVRKVRGYPKRYALGWFAMGSVLTSLAFYLWLM